MKKIKCRKYIWYSGSAIFGIIGMSNLFGFEQWSKYSGWHQPNQILGAILFICSIAVYIYIDKNCKDIKTVKCVECGEVFFDSEDSKCPLCKNKLIDVNIYYKS